MVVTNADNPQNRLNQATIGHLRREMMIHRLRRDAFVTLLPLLTPAPKFRIVSAR